jgi:hypothetical protein
MEATSNNNEEKKTSTKTVEELKEVKEKVDFLNTEISNRLNTFESKRNQNRKEAIALKIISSILGALITILLGLKLGTGFEAAAVNIALVLGATISIVNTFEVFWNPKSLWIKYTVTTNELRSLRSDIEYLTKKGIDKITVKEIDELYKRYCTILKETNKSWQKYRSEEE